MAFRSIYFLILALSLKLHMANASPLVPVILEALDAQNISELTELLDSCKHKLSCQEQTVIANHAQNLYNRHEQESLLDTQAKKSLSACVCVGSFSAALWALSVPFQASLFAIYHQDASIIFDSKVTALCSLGAFFMGLAIASGYDNMTGYYSNKPRYMLNIVYNTLPYFTQKLGPDQAYAF
jgi:uncharacterized protein YfkK (UPF0435 family)